MRKKKQQQHQNQPEERLKIKRKKIGIIIQTHTLDVRMYMKIELKLCSVYICQWHTYPYKCVMFGLLDYRVCNFDYLLRFSYFMICCFFSVHLDRVVCCVPLIDHSKKLIIRFVMRFNAIHKFNNVRAEWPFQCT